MVQVHIYRLLFIKITLITTNMIVLFSFEMVLLEKLMVIISIYELQCRILSARINVIGLVEIIHLYQPIKITSHFFAQTCMSDIFTSYSHHLNHFCM